jgi:hypothetical protein
MVFPWRGETKGAFASDDMRLQMAKRYRGAQKKAPQHEGPLKKLERNY